jgi:hypothetical protein
MAKERVTHVCGHSETHNLYGARQERNRQADRLETALCTECYYQKKERERDEQGQAETQAVRETVEATLTTPDAR